MSATAKITLADCTAEDMGHCGGTRWTHEASGAYVELIHDDSPSNPLEDAEGVAISYREGDHYNGTMDDHPRDPVIECPSCEGSGEGDRFELRPRFGAIVAAGSQAAMDAAAELFGYSPWDISAKPCTRCKGAGEIDCTLLEWFKHEHDAVAIHEFSTGDYREASAVIVITDNDWTDPQSAAKAWADEYESWASGDVWGIEYGGPGVESESCWGFIGRTYAEDEAQRELQGAIEDAMSERAENAHWAARDTITVDS